MPSLTEVADRAEELSYRDAPEVLCSVLSELAHELEDDHFQASRHVRSLVNWTEDCGVDEELLERLQKTAKSYDMDENELLEVLTKAKNSDSDIPEKLLKLLDG